MMNNNNGGPCRILVIGSPRARVIKVTSILQQLQYGTCQIPPPIDQQTSKSTLSELQEQQEQQKVPQQKTNQQQQQQQNESSTTTTSINIEYIPCVAKFDSYRNETNDRIRYLLRVDYYGKDCTDSESSTLLEFFDNTATSSGDNQDGSILLNSINENTTGIGFDSTISIDKVLSLIPLFPTDPIVIVGAVIIGLDSPEVIDESKDIDMIKTFIQTLSNNTNNSTIPIETIQPSTPYKSMVEEFNAIKLLSNDERHSPNVTIGPNKMAKLAYTFASTLVVTRYQQLVDEIIVHNKNIDEKQKQTTTSTSSNSSNGLIIDNQPVDNNNNNETKQDNKSIKVLPNFNNTSINRYACKKCRCIVFDNNDLENPPHIPSTHKFSYRKQRHSGYISTTTTIGSGGVQCNTGDDTSNDDNDTTTTNDTTTHDQCQSYFLQENCYILNTNMIGTCTNTDRYNTTEGKLLCPKCKQKLGNYNWSGAQCSCGTWTVPAIQIPKSKVDIIYPNH